ncbi:MAG: uracil-DNA glycosylase [Methanolinea sp.]|nr:uracil-DNA glycosylase [Methanolinea sp.]
MDRDADSTVSPGVLMDILAGEIAGCTRCALSLSRTRTVPGEGPVPCTYLFVGEAPGRTEDETGRPFAGRAGKVLSGMLAISGLSREEVFVTSVVKCRPPRNRVPKKGEIASCLPYLREEVHILSPAVVVPMGRIATQAVFSLFGIPFSSFREARRRRHAVHPRDAGGAIAVFPVFHPAVVTHNPAMARELECDFRALARLVQECGGR